MHSVLESVRVHLTPIRMGQISDGQTHQGRSSQHACVTELCQPLKFL